MLIPPSDFLYNIIMVTEEEDKEEKINISRIVPSFKYGKDSLSSSVQFENTSTLPMQNLFLNSKI